jgi:hypothetical protein
MFDFGDLDANNFRVGEFRKAEELVFKGLVIGLILELFKKYYKGQAKTRNSHCKEGKKVRVNIKIAIIQHHASLYYFSK